MNTQHSMSEQAPSYWKSVKDDIAAIYKSSWAFALVCPLLFLIPVLAEFAQHIYEVRAGMYQSLESARAMADDSARLMFGFAKTLALVLPGYWFTRYIMFGGDAAAARRIEWPAIGLWLALFILQAFQQYWTLFGTEFGVLIGLSGEPAKTATMVFAINVAIFSILSLYLIVTFTAMPLGKWIGPFQSFKIMKGHFWRIILYLLAAVAPLFMVHYGLAYAAMGMPPILVWTLMILDSFIVGYLALTLNGSRVIAAKRAAKSSNISLLP